MQLLQCILTSVLKQIGSILPTLTFVLENCKDFPNFQTLPFHVCRRWPRTEQGPPSRLTELGQLYSSPLTALHLTYNGYRFLGKKHTKQQISLIWQQQLGLFHCLCASQLLRPSNDKNHSRRLSFVIEDPPQDLTTYLLLCLCCAIFSPNRRPFLIGHPDQLKTFLAMHPIKGTICYAIHVAVAHFLTIICVFSGGIGRYYVIK